MARARVVTLTSDTGPVYAAQMKAALLRRLPASRIVDITHELPAHAIGEAAFVVAQVASAFPRGTVHVVVVDPGVGGGRAPLAIRCRDGSVLVGPDNGVLAPLAARLGGPKAFRLDPKRVRPGGAVSPTFEGRDLFAPAAARIATGTMLEKLGRPTTFRRYAVPRPRRTARRIHGAVVHVDRFGNLITNVPSDWIPEVNGTLPTYWGRRRVGLPRRRVYSELARGAVGVLGSSFGTLEVSVREGDAARRLRLGVGDAIAFGRPGKTVNSADRR